MNAPVRWQNDKLLLNVVIQPKAANNAVVGLHGDRIKLRISAPPSDGRANTALLKYLAKEFRLPQSRLQLLKGNTSRNKQISVQQPDYIPPWLAALLPDSATT